MNRRAVAVDQDVRQVAAHRVGNSMPSRWQLDRDAAELPLPLAATLRQPPRGIALRSRWKVPEGRRSFALEGDLEIDVHRAPRLEIHLVLEHSRCMAKGVDRLGARRRPASAKGFDDVALIERRSRKARGGCDQYH